VNQSLTPKPKAYSYIRYSTPEQGKGNSLARQTEAARRYAAEHDLDLDESLRDLGVSAYHGFNRIRGALGSFLRRVESGEIPTGSYLLVESLDRVSREEAMKAFTLFTGLVGAGITIVTIADGCRVYSQEVLSEQPMKLLESLLYMILANDESKRKSRRVGEAAKARRNAAIATGRPFTGRCVEWCRLVGGRYELVPERAAVVRRIFEMCVSGSGLWLIAATLNREGLEPWGRGGQRGKCWRRSYVVKILSNKATFGCVQFYLMVNGKRVPEGPEVRDYYPPVVSEETFMLAAAARERRTNKGGPKGAGVVNLFQGLIRCGHCDVSMTSRHRGKPPKGGRYLMCGTAREGAACTNPKTTWRYERLEEELLGLISAIDWVALTGGSEERARMEGEVEAHRARASAIESEVSSLLSAFGDGAPIPQVIERVRNLSGESEAVKARLAKASEALAMSRAKSHEDARAIYYECLDRMDDGTPEEQTAIRLRLAEAIRKVVGRIDLSGERIKVWDIHGNVMHHTFPIGGELPPKLRRHIQKMRNDERARYRAEREATEGCGPD